MREKHIDLIEVHVSGICFKGDSVFLAKRSPSRKLYPNLWECGGGQVRSGENFEEAAARQLKEELGLTVEPIMPFKAYEIIVPGLKQNKIPGLRIVCQFKGFANGKGPQISEEHTEWKIVPLDELDDIELIPGLKEDIIEGYSIYGKPRGN